MKMHWTALGLGVVVGGLLAWWRSSAKGAVAPFGDAARFNLRK